MLPYDRRKVIEQVKFTFSPLGKAFKAQIKTIEDQGTKQVEALKAFKSRRKSRTKINWRIFSKKKNES